MNLLQQSDIIAEVTEEPWLGNEMYILKKEDQHLLLSKDVWLNDRIMDAAQKLICKEIGTDESYQSVLQESQFNPFISTISRWRRKTTRWSQLQTFNNRLRRRNS